MLHVPTYLCILRSPHYEIPPHTALKKKKTERPVSQDHTFFYTNYYKNEWTTKQTNSGNVKKSPPYHSLRGTRWHSWLRHCATRRTVALSIHYGVIQISHWHNPTGRTIHRVESASNRYEYQEYFLGVKAAGAWQYYHLNVPTVLKSGNLDLLEPTGPVQACNGIALPLPLTKSVQ